MDGKFPCYICEQANEERNCFDCIFGEFTDAETCHTYECKYHVEDYCVVNAYERCKAWTGKRTPIDPHSVCPCD